MCIRSSSSISPCRFSSFSVRYTVLRSTLASSFWALRKSWAASRCLVAVSITRRMARRCSVMRIPRSARCDCRRPGISVCGSGMETLPGAVATALRRIVWLALDGVQAYPSILKLILRCDTIATRNFSDYKSFKIMRNFSKISLHVLCVPFLLLELAFAGVGGSISGTIKDPSGAAIPKASVALVNANTGVRQSAYTDDHGVYAFPVLPVGEYILEVNHPGFQPYRRTGIVLNTNSALLLDVVLRVGERSDAITVSDSAVHLETYSSQVGEVINSEQMSAVPLNGRSYTDLLALQPGVAPATSINSNTVQDVG